MARVGYVVALLLMPVRHVVAGVFVLLATGFEFGCMVCGLAAISALSQPGPKRGQLPLHEVGRAQSAGLFGQPRRSVVRVQDHPDRGR